jgi:MFS family permease
VNAGATKSLIKPKPSWILFWLSSSVGVSMIGLGIIWPLVPVMAVEIGAKGIQIGLIIASFNIARSITNPIVGRISDHLGRKPFMVVGLLIYALVSGFYVMVSSVEGLIGTRLIHGFASVLVAPIAMALIADIAPRQKLGLFMGTMSMATMLGIGIGPVLGGIIRDLFGMDAAFHTMGGLVLATLIGVMLFIPGASGKTDSDRRQTQTKPYKELLYNRTFQALFALRLFAAAGQGAVYTFLPLLAMRMHLSSSQVGIALGANIFLIAALQRLFGRIADRHNPVLLMIGGTFVSGLTVLSMPYVQGFAAILFLNCAMGIANGVAMPGGYVLAGRLGRAYGMASVMGLSDSAWSLGMIFSPIFSGFVLDLMGMQSVFSLGGAFILCGALFTWLLLRKASAPCPGDTLN